MLRRQRAGSTAYDPRAAEPTFVETVAGCRQAWLEAVADLPSPTPRVDSRSALGRSKDVTIQAMISSADEYGSSCYFCSILTSDQILCANDLCLAVWTEEVGAPEGSTMVLPKAHRETVWDLTEAEWTATRRLLLACRERVAALYRPDGWNVGWNVGPVGGQTVAHAHCHVVPRYRDEPFAGRGIRSWIKDPANRRPQSC
jgi:diadenosine tetraphosphate (Ap4A) HIT family hydrolase